ncbi:acyl-CoA desaturase [Verticillium alfalfae VaMs.102]|uniref:Acyl-CoA desaturase n=1 Tax=Verticillium alfalfae (strain VaMs.102 / ATCC MYA-4576 / FGSC 10136) TaxID=526221 RepID=C9SJD3_VERA1|nr:acyl-CoA desaturase [Verticillium alfalfae VaMs.102]EEY18295.1 acyl-CoA desaturase [Verticillium alfalfae VaMs.102]
MTVPRTMSPSAVPGPTPRSLTSPPSPSLGVTGGFTSTGSTPSSFSSFPPLGSSPLTGFRSSGRRLSSLLFTTSTLVSVSQQATIAFGLTHPTRASLPLKIYLAAVGAGAVEGSIRWWSREHRAHHRYTDTVKDPLLCPQGSSVLSPRLDGHEAGSQAYRSYRYHRSSRGPRRHVAAHSLPQVVC